MRDNDGYKPRLRWTPIGQDVALLAGLVVVVVASIAVATWPSSQNPGPADLQLLEQQPTTRPSVAFIGDSYVGGSNMGGNGAANITSLLAQRFSWRVVNAAVGGTGYVVATAPGTQPFESQVPQVIAAQPSLIVVMGSRNDAGKGGIEIAANKLYSTLHRELPQARIVVVGPEWIDENPPDSLTEARDNIAAAARSAGLAFVDPIADGWFAGPTANLIGVDGVHPIDAGHAHMAQLLGDDLQRLNLTR